MELRAPLGPREVRVILESCLHASTFLITASSRPDMCLCPSCDKRDTREERAGRRSVVVRVSRWCPSGHPSLPLERASRSQKKGRKKHKKKGGARRRWIAGGVIHEEHETKPIAHRSRTINRSAHPRRAPRVSTHSPTHALSRTTNAACSLVKKEKKQSWTVGRG